MPGIIDVATEVSNGIYSIKKIAELARTRGIKVVIYADHFLERIEYGIPPFRNIIKKTIKMRCIKEYGIEKYISEIDRVNRLFPDMLLIPGCEVRPIHYWTGSAIKKSLVLHNMQKKFLIIGLGAEELGKLPIIGNVRLSYDQYHGDPGYTPYQDVIDYTIDNNGVIFWTLPEAGAEEKRGGIVIKMPPHPESLLKTHGYTGFGIIYEGMKKIGIPGGIWDAILKEYMEGQREKPIWAMGEIDYHYEGDAGRKRIETVQTVFLVKKFDKESVINAMRKGRMYAMNRTREHALSLDEFSINGKACMGDEIKISSTPVLRFRLSSGLDSIKVTVKIIRSGEVVRVFNLITPVEVQFKDEYFKPGKWAYYRLAIRGEGCRVFTNPIFVRFPLR